MTLVTLNVIALILSVILCWHYLKGGSMLGCDGTSACEQVLSSKWSVLAGRVPVSGLAMGVYLAMLIAILHISPTTEIALRRMAWGMMLILAGSITGSAIWLMIIQKWMIGEFCPYCMTEHVIGMLMSVIIIWRAMTESTNPNNLKPTDQTIDKNSYSTKWYPGQRLSALGFVVAGLLLAGILVISQIAFIPKAVYTEGKSQDSLPAFTYRNAPIIGPPDAPYMIKLLFDYNCPHCQKVHDMLNDLVDRYHGKLAVVLCPAPLNTQCNTYIPRDVDAFKTSCELTKIGLAVWVAKHDALPAFNSWMFSPEPGAKWHPKTPEAARAKAMELVGKANFDAAWASPWIEQYLETCVQIYGQTIQTGKGGVPKMIFGSHWVIPQPGNTDDLMIILQKSLSLPKP
jgi:uncharacterized membrane protein/protein-disulfide isomerase